jgi:hypothetical protein
LTLPDTIRLVVRDRDRPPTRFNPRGEPYDPDDIPIGLPGDGPLHSELHFWLYIGKGLLIMIVGGFVLSIAMYGVFELLSLLAGE